MDDTEILRSVLYQLLITYPNGLDNRGWDIEELSKNPYLPPCYISDNLHLSWNWRDISMHIITDDFLERFEDLIDWKTVSHNESLSEEAIDHYWDRLHHFYIGCNPALTDALIEKYGGTPEEMLNWKSPFNSFYLLTKSNPSISTIEKYAEVWHRDKTSEYCDGWNIISEDQSIPVTLEFVKKFKNKLTWKYLSGNCNLNAEIVEFMLSNSCRYRFNEVDMERISRNLIYLESEDAKGIVEAYGDRLDITNYQLQCKLVELSDEETIEYILDNNYDWKQWITLCTDLSLDLEVAKLLFLKVPDWHKPNVDWDQLSDTDNINMEILEEYKDYWNYDLLSLHAPVEFITSYPELGWNPKKLSIRKYQPSISYMKVKSARSK